MSFYDNPMPFSMLHTHFLPLENNYRTNHLFCSLYKEKHTFSRRRNRLHFQIKQQADITQTKKFQYTLFGTTRLLSLFEFHLSDMQKFFSFLSPSVHTFPKDPHTCPINTQTLTQTGSLPCFLSERISLCFILTRERQSGLRPQTI